MSWALPSRVLTLVIEHASQTAPAECCGVLLGSEPQIVDAVRGRNLSTNPNRFLLDPRDHIAARRLARARGLEVVGFYHSHPRSSAYPSATDVAEVTYSDAVHLIVSLQGDPRARLFRISAAHVDELPMSIIDS